MENIESATLSTKEFSTRTGLPVATITKLLRSGRIIGKKCSGKWMISQDQLHSKAVLSLGGSSSTSGIKSTPSKINPPKQTYSIREFSQITYLTEFGVEQWIKGGKIKGYQDDKGQWQVDADSLNFPILQHLLRNRA